MRDTLLDQMLDAATTDAGHTPHGYQRDACHFLYENPFSALFADVGLGKAMMSLTVLARVLWDLDSGQALVVAPIRVVKQTWPTEIAEWHHVNWLDHTLVRAEDNDPDVKVVYDRYRIRFLQAAKALGVPANVRGGIAAQFAAPFRDRAKKDLRTARAMMKTPVHLIGVEGLPALAEYHGKAWPYRTLVGDESSKWKDHTTQRYKALLKVRKHITRLHWLTASPAPESMMDLFAQILMLDGGERLGRRITHFRRDHFVHNEYTRSYTLIDGHDKIISEKISDICMVMKAEDYLPLDKPQLLPRYIELSDETISLYDSFVETFVLSLPDAEIEALNGGALIAKLLQFTGGAVYDEDKNIHEVHDDKIEDLRQLADEIDTPIMVHCWYQSSLKRVKKAFPHAVIMDKGGKAVDDWNAGKIKMLLINAASAGHGLNMQKGPGHDLYWFDLCWSRELYEQLIGRLARQGQKKIVRVWHAIVRRRDDGVRRSARDRDARMTADEIVMRALEDKGAGQDALFRFIRDIRSRAVASRQLAAPAPAVGSSETVKPAGYYDDL